MDWNKVRNDFPVTKNCVYFQSAGMSPLPKPVYQTYVNEYKRLMDFGDTLWEKDMKAIDKVKSDIAGIINSSEDDLTFLNNTSTAMSLAALAMGSSIKKEGGHILSMTDEFPSSTVPWEYQKIKMIYVSPENKRYATQSILDKIDSKTAGVLTSYVQYNTGFRQNLLKLGKELYQRRIPFIVNSTQGFPFFPLDVKEMKISVLTASLHKWGFAGYVGSLFYTSPTFREKYPTGMAGWLSVQPPECSFILTEKNIPLKVHKTAGQYNFGTINLQPLKALGTALNYLNEIGLDNCRSRIYELTDYLITQLTGLPLTLISPVSDLSERSSIISFHLMRKNEECVGFLSKNKIMVSFRDKAIRISLNIFNNYEDIDKLIWGIKEFLGN